MTDASIITGSQQRSSWRTPSWPGPEPHRPRTLAPVVSLARAVLVFLLAGLLVLVCIAAVLAWEQRRAATRAAVGQAVDVTALVARDVVAPALTDDALTPGPAYDRLDRVVREHVLGAGIVRVKIWDAGGQIVYSDDTSLVGRRFQLGEDDLTALRGGPPSAEVSALTAAENVHEAQYGRLLQVYLGVQTPSGQPLLLETYQPYDTVLQVSRRLWLAGLPVLVGGLVLLYLVQAPLAYRMARRLRRVQEEREQLLVASLAASDRERARIAADLHSGVVQGLVGAGWSLTAASRSAREAGDDRTAALTEATAADLRRWVRELRTLVVTVTPPALHASGLAAPLSDLLGMLEHRGIEVVLDAEGLDELPEEAETLTFRVAQEAVRNIARHAEARHVRLQLRQQQEPPALVLSVEDDGRGFDPSSVSRRHGSVGLDLLTSVVQAQGGVLDVASAPDAGDHRAAHAPPSGGPLVIRVLLVDDHALVRQGLLALLDAVPDIEVVGAVADGADAPDAAERLSPDVVLMDLSMPGVGGVPATRAVLARCPAAKVVVLTSFVEEARVREALGAGAIGYLLKDAEPEDVIRGVHDAAAGHAPLSPRAALALLPSTSARAQPALSAREREVLALVAVGLPNKSIARRLEISEKTVKAHLTKVFSVIGVGDRTSAALWAQRNGVV